MLVISQPVTIVRSLSITIRLPVAFNFPFSPLLKLIFKIHHETRSQILFRDLSTLTGEKSVVKEEGPFFPVSHILLRLRYSFQYLVVRN